MKFIYGVIIPVVIVGVILGFYFKIVEMATLIHSRLTIYILTLTDSQRARQFLAKISRKLLFGV